MVLSTVDGSRLTGIVESKSVLLATDHGNIELRVPKIETIRFNEDRTLMEVSLANGDRLTGRVEAEHFQLATAIGRLSVPWTELVELSVAPNDVTAEDVMFRPTPVRPTGLDLTLRDGSRLFGTPDHDFATAFCPMGRVALPWTVVRKVVFHEDRESAMLELWNGDSLAACVDWRAFALSTGVGLVHVSTVHTQEIQLSLGGIDLVQKPYESATGDRYFKGDLEHPGPKRIQGRIFPASQFIKAHAGGRIEYAFDRPIREFHAVLTMYESYNATKGNVRFKVETDQGLVYTSPDIRNGQKKDVYLRFQPTKKLVLITDPNGRNDEDWSVWLHPEVR